MLEPDEIKGPGGYFDTQQITTNDFDVGGVNNARYWLNPPNPQVSDHAGAMALVQNPNASQALATQPAGS